MKLAKMYKYEPVGMDVFDARKHQPKRGTVVVKCSGGSGAPKNGTMSHCYVKDATTDEFYGLVLEKSLVPVGLIEVAK